MFDIMNFKNACSFLLFILFAHQVTSRPSPNLRNYDEFKKFHVEIIDTYKKDKNLAAVADVIATTTPAVAVKLDPQILQQHDLDESDEEIVMLNANGDEQLSSSSNSIDDLNLLDIPESSSQMLESAMPTLNFGELMESPPD